LGLNEFIDNITAEILNKYYKINWRGDSSQRKKRLE
jgi:hypothetical protein